MAVSAKVLIFAAAALFVGGAACAQQAERCEGTLCDLYYNGRGNAPAATAAPATATGVPPGATAMTVPSGGIMNWFSRSPSSSATTATAAPGAPAAPQRPPVPEEAPSTASNSYMHLSAGGLLGGHQERCSGTLCDTFYGSSPQETTPGAQQTAAIGAPAAEPRIAHRHIVHESETRPKCSSPTADPWHCFR